MKDKEKPQRDPDELGALWMKQGRKGEYMTGEINGVRVICFPTDLKSKTAPYWRVLKSRPRTDEAEKDVPAQIHEAVAAPADDDIPF